MLNERPGTEVICPLCTRGHAVNLGAYQAKTALFRGMDLWRCSACDVIFVSPVPSDESLTEYYQTYWQTGVQRSDQVAQDVFRAQADARLDYVAGRIGSLDGFHVLDVGAGHGLIYDALLDRNVADFTYTAVEVDDEARAKFERRGLAVYRDWRGLEGRGFDLVVLSHVVEHVPSPVDLLREIGAVSGPQSVIFVEVPYHDHLYKQWLEPHLSVFNPQSVATLFERAGLQVLDVQSCGRLLKSLIPQSHQRPANRAAWLAKRMVSRATRMVSNRRLLGGGQAPDHDSRYQMRTYGEDRQWIRALVRCEPEGVT